MFDNRIAVVTGGAHGIGRAIAEKFLGEGHRVFGFDLRASSLESPAYRHFCYDVCAEEGPGLEETPEILISCAGTIEEEKAIDVNLRGAIRFAQRYADAPGLRSVLFIASASARNGAEFPQYVASKAGLVGYMKNLALSVSRRGMSPQHERTNIFGAKASSACESFTSQYISHKRSWMNFFSISVKFSGASHSRLSSHSKRTTPHRPRSRFDLSPVLVVMELT